MCGLNIIFLQRFLFTNRFGRSHRISVSFISLYKSRKPPFNNYRYNAVDYKIMHDATTDMKFCSVAAMSLDLLYRWEKKVQNFVRKIKQISWHNYLPDECSKYQRWAFTYQQTTGRRHNVVQNQNDRTIGLEHLKVFIENVGCRWNSTTDMLHNILL